MQTEIIFYLFFMLFYASKYSQYMKKFKMKVVDVNEIRSLISCIKISR